MVKVIRSYMRGKERHFSDGTYYLDSTYSTERGAENRKKKLRMAHKKVRFTYGPMGDISVWAK